MIKIYIMLFRSFHNLGLLINIFFFLILELAI